MLDYSFLEILSSLTRDELKSFRRFLLSPYFNRSKKVVKLYDRLIKFYPSFDNAAVTKENLHKHISPELPYNEITMRRLLLDLQKLCEKFMTQVFLEKKETESRLLAIEELAMRGNERMHAHSVRDVKNILAKNEVIDADTCMNFFRLETEQFYFKMIHGKVDKNSFVESEALKLINGISYLISYFMLEAIKHNDVLLNYSRSFNVKGNDKFIGQFISLFDLERLEIFMKEHSLTGHNIIKLYINTLRAYLYMDNDYYYEEFKKSLYQSIDKLNGNDINFLFARILGYCILKTRKSEKTDDYFEIEQLKHYKTILQKKYYETPANKFIPTDLFRNILIQAAKLGELKWMEDFIEDYGRLLHPHKRSEVMLYANAILYFERNAYDEALSCLSRINSEEFSYHIDIRNLYIRIYFEQEDYESALSAARNFRKFLKENPMVAEDKKSSNLQFTAFVIKLINYHNTNSKTDPTTLEMQIRKSENTVSKFWLLDKVTSLEKSARRAV